MRIFYVVAGVMASGKWGVASGESLVISRDWDLFIFNFLLFIFSAVVPEKQPARRKTVISPKVHRYENDPACYGTSYLLCTQRTG